MEIINTLLLEALSGEIDAEERYSGYAAQAVAEGYPGVAALFTGLSHAEAVHAANHLRAMEKNGFTGALPKPATPENHGQTRDNAVRSLEGELKEFKSMYPSMTKQISRKHGREFVAKIALLSLKWAAESEKNHHALLKEAVRGLDSGIDMDRGHFYLCTVCGNLHYSPDPPGDLCPVCGHDPLFYSKVDVLQ